MLANCDERKIPILNGNWERKKTVVSTQLITRLEFNVIFDRVSNWKKVSNMLHTNTHTRASQFSVNKLNKIFSMEQNNNQRLISDHYRRLLISCCNMANLKCMRYITNHTSATERFLLSIERCVSWLCSSHRSQIKSSIQWKCKIYLDAFFSLSLLFRWSFFSQESKLLLISVHVLRL